jgi:hypothetical protein
MPSAPQDRCLDSNLRGVGKATVVPLEREAGNDRSKGRQVCQNEFFGSCSARSEYRTPWQGVATDAHRSGDCAGIGTVDETPILTRRAIGVRRRGRESLVCLELPRHRNLAPHCQRASPSNAPPGTLLPPKSRDRGPLCATGSRRDASGAIMATRRGIPPFPEALSYSFLNSASSDIVTT